MIKILVVEDNEINQSLIKRRLEKRGFEILISSDGVEGLKQMKEWSPDLVLLDLSLPKMDGWEVAKNAKADQTIKQIPIIALTAHAMDGDREKAIEAGCDEYENKPIEIKSLMEKIEKLLNENK